MQQKLLDLAGTVVQTGFKRILAKRRSDHEAGTPLSALIASRSTDLFVNREFEQHVSTLTLKVAKQLNQLCRNELKGLDEGEQAVAVERAAAAFGRVSVSDTELFAVDVRPERIAAKALEAEAPQANKVGFSEAGQRFYELLTHYTAECLVQLITSLPNYQPRALTELLDRSTQVEQKLDAALRRIPVPSLLAPQGTDLDEEFRARYLRAVSEELDELELFGVDVRRFQARTTLSVAYIGLSVRTRHEVASRRHDPRDPHRWQEERETSRIDHVVRVEEILGRAERILIRGEAGSGKTTLLRWLAVNAARSSFQRGLAELNGMVPILIKLRSWEGKTLPQPQDYLDGTAPELVGIMPPGFVHRLLDSGRALVLVDGVDELPGSERQAARRWLSRMVTRFPKTRVVVTSRPSAATETWLQDKGFAGAMLERMSPADVRELVRHWHLAVRDAGNLPCRESDLPEYERDILTKLDTSADLRALATTPLLCAMLCALNLDRHRHLPRNRVELYRAALAMLIDRRDAERQISIAIPNLGEVEKRTLLRDLAWRLSINNRSELRYELAVERVAEKLKSMPGVNRDGETVFSYLLERSGVIREPQAGRIDFVHRTFQEFLTAAQAADNGDMGLLVGNAHRDQWQEIVTLAAGLANAPQRRELISGLLERADEEKRHARRLRILAASCLETMPDVEPEPHARIESGLKRLLPPRTKAEATSLARIGAALLPRLDRDPGRLTEAAASATVWAIALVNGPDAITMLCEFTHDSRKSVQDALVDAWSYFDPERYAREVLADAPLDEAHLTISNPNLLPAVRYLRHLASLSMTFYSDMDLSLLDEVPHVTSISTFTDIDDVSPLECHSGLERVSLYSDTAFDPSPLARLPQLRELTFTPVADMDLSFLSRCEALRELTLAAGEFRGDLSPVWNLAELEDLDLGEIPPGIDLSGLSAMRGLVNLALHGDPDAARSPAPNGLASLPEWVPRLNSLTLSYMDIGDALVSISKLPLTGLTVESCSFKSLKPLSAFSVLRSLWLKDLDTAPDIADLAAIPRLDWLDLDFPADEPLSFDFASFGDRELGVTVSKAHNIRNVGPGIQLRLDG